MFKNVFTTVFTKSVLLIVVTLTMFSFTAMSQVKTGDQAPSFELKGHDGKTYKLSDFKDKYVVLEWFNDECPYVVKHYQTNNMQNLQNDFMKKEVVWFVVSSSAPKKQGHLTAETAKTILEKNKSTPTALLLDHDGKVGKMFDAKTTPHMYIINPKGQVVYQGAIDDNSSSKHATVKTAVPLFKNALTAAMANKTIANATNKPYGCSVKY